MSATMGTGLSEAICRRASAALASGTATLTISAPREARLLTYSSVLTASRVSVAVMVWTATGAPPPTGTSPTRMPRVFR